MDRRDRARLFRARLGEAMDRAGTSRSALAAKLGIDRSTLAQLLSQADDRLPRSDTAASLAGALKVSLDWLMGLSQEARLGADILLESVQMTASAGEPVDENLARWHREATGYKIRHVPATLPDMVKTDAVIAHEYRDFAAKTEDRALSERQDRLAYSRQPETDMEICAPLQGLTAFAEGNGLWRELSVEHRRRQIDRLIELMDELYPSVRMYLFDGRTHYSVPYTVFGPLKAAVYMGQMYFVFNTTEHVHRLVQHFDGLIRAAVVPAHDSAAFFRRLRDQMPAA